MHQLCYINLKQSIMSSLKNKVILITGASKGMGALMAQKMAEAGAKVIVNYVGGKAEADKVVEGIKKSGGDAIAVQADVSKSVDVKALFDDAIAWYGKVDVLVNNAGIMHTKLIKDSTDEDFTQHFDVNVRGTFNTLREAATRLADNGTVINFSSSVNRLMLPTYAIYSSTKAAVEQMARVFAKEVGRGININCVAPGPTNTELFIKGKTKEMIDRLASLSAFNRIGEPIDTVRVVLFLASDDAKWISAQTIGVNGGMA
jgi:3-oxoacyl-[acyl-carrier protein] reductase